MRARFTFLSGGHSGESTTLDGAYLSVGRQASSDLRFHPESDLQVSGHHATIFQRGSFFVLRDAGSVNGTFVNGVRLTADHLLADEDVIQFGARGPRVRFEIVREPADHHPGSVRLAVPPVRMRPRSPARRGHATPSSQPPRWRPTPGTHTRIRAEVARQTAPLRRVTYAAAAVAALSVSALVWQRVSQNARFEADRQIFLARADSLMQEMGSLTINMETLRGRFDSVQAEAAQLRDSVSRPDQDPEDVMLLRRRLEDALALQRQLTLAAALDLNAIAKANQAAIGIVLAAFPDGTRVTGTGFGIRSDRIEGLVLTAKHVVLGIDGAPAETLDIVFEGSTRARHLEVVSVHPDVDIALLRTSARGAVPAVAAIQWREPPVAVGDAVATIGYPLGFDLPMGGEWEHVGITATASPGSVTRVLQTLIQFDGFGVEGSSGSPVFDRTGSVVGLVYGSQAGGRGRILYSVPIVYALELLDGMP